MTATARRFALILVGIFAAEWLVHVVLGNVRPASPVAGAFLDALALTLLCIPVVAFMFSRRLARLRTDARAESIMQSSLDGILTSDVKGRISHLNASAEKMFGYAWSEVVGQNVTLLLPQQGRSLNDEALARSLFGSGGPRAPKAVRMEGRRKNGEVFPAEVITAVSGGGDDAMQTTVVHDVGERMQLERARKSSEERYRSLFSSMLNGFAYCRMLYDERERPVDFVHLEVNEAFGRLTGLKDVVGKPVSEVIPGIHELSPELLDACGRVASSGRPEMFEFDFKSQSRWLDISVSSSEPGTFVAIFEDITERKRADKALALFRSLLDRSSDSIEVVDPATGRLLDVNEQCCRSLGYSREELLTMNVIDIAPRLDLASFGKINDRLQESGVLLLEGLHRRKDGSVFPVEVSLSHAQLDRPYHISVVRDISERKRSEQDRLLQVTALNSAADPIVITNREGTIEWINAAFSKSTGYSAEEAIGQNPRSLLKSGVHEAVLYRDMWDTILAGNVWRGELVNRRKDGSHYPEMTTITPVRNAQSEISHFVAVKRDLTREKQLQSQYLQAQKLESVGRLVGGIAHDFNNLLSVIIGWTELAMAELPEAHLSRAPLDEVLSAGQGAARLTRQLLAFSRRQNVELTVFDVNRLVAEVEKMVRRLVGEDVKFETRADPEAGAVHMDRGQLEQVLMNLVVNARDAMPAGGRLTIETAAVVLDAAYEWSHADVVSGPYVMIAVSDSGSGMSDEVKAHLFEPFFTTKERGKGTGLGLATCYGIVKQARGHIGVYSEVGIGTSMKVYLPLSRETAEAATAGQSRPCRGTETILVVDDDERVRRMTGRVLETRGYRVLSAGTGSDALRMIETQREPPHLLLTDVVLGDGMSGPQLAERVRLLRPEMKVLFVSGYTSEVTVLHGLREHGGAFVQKPFTADSLCQKVRQLLGPSRPAEATLR